MSDITIAEEFREIRHRMLQSFIEPRMVTFSNQGYYEMMKESLTQDMLPQDSATYMGLPYEIRPNQAGRVALHDAIPGTVIRQRVPKARMCDLIRDYLDADDPKNWGPFEKMLDAAVVKHGEFE